MTAATILHEAEIELWEAVAYYESRASGLGLDFLAEIAESVHAITEAPDRWPLLRDGTRRRLMHRFPYVVVYVRLPDHIWTVAFAHCKRRPQFWSGRIKKAEQQGGEYSPPAARPSNPTP